MERHSDVQADARLMVSYAVQIPIRWCVPWKRHTAFPLCAIKQLCSRTMSPKFMEQKDLAKSTYAASNIHSIFIGKFQ